MSASQNTIAIVGGGFSGTALALNLLRIQSTGPLRIVLIEQREQVGRGVAYAHSVHPYLLNVPASRMSVNPASPLEFLEFARSRDAHAGADDYLPRSLYGDYLQDLLRRARAETTADFRIVRGTALAVSGGAGESFTVRMDRLPPIEADRVALCIGAPPAAPVCPLEASTPGQGYVGSAYESIDFSGYERILLLGTGLTMADIVVAADAQNPRIVVHALSRHGLTPKAQSVAPPVVANLFDIDALRDRSLRSIFKLSRAMAGDIARRGGDWRDVVVALRAVASRLWSEWADGDRRRFLRHMRTYWDIHRHRLPPATMAHLQRLRDAQRLHVHAGRILQLRQEGGRVRAEWVSRPGGERREGWFDRVINCTGASGRLEVWDDSLIGALRSQRLISADALGLGLRTGENCVVIGADGAPTESLYYLGPMLRADHWEATAISELRHHAAQLAHHLLGRR